jgi:hypothetical protein
MLRSQVLKEMKRVFAEVPYGIEHTRRVLQHAETIAAGEQLPNGLQEIITTAAILHDSGALEAQRKYGSMDGHYQEKEGEILARQILEQMGAAADLRERACFLVGHHHSPAMIDGLDFQILWEADLLDNTEFGDQRPEARELEQWIQKNFQTAAGQRLARERLSKTQP